MEAVRQIITAAVLGTQAFTNGARCIPAHDPELMSMLKGRPLGETPAGEASTIRLLEEWANAWHAANLKP